MNRKSKLIKCFVGTIILLLVSLNANQTISNIISASNQTEFVISGNTGNVADPRTVCLGNNEIVILWREGDGILKIAKYNSSLDRTTDSIILVNASLLTSEEFELSQPNILKDTSDNLHIFWYIMDFDTPQQGDIYYLKIDAKFQIIVPAKIIHTYTHSGIGSSCFEDIFRTLFISEVDTIHLLVADNTYYLLNVEGTITASTVVPAELGEVQELILDNEDNAIIVSENGILDSINSIVYNTSGTTITEEHRNMLFNTSEIIIFYTRLLRVESNIYFYWIWENKSDYIYKYDSYLLNQNGSLGNPGTLNEHFYLSSYYYLNTTHTTCLQLEQGIYNPVDCYFSLFHPTENHSYIESKLMFRILKNESIFWGPVAFNLKIIQDKNSQFIISYYVNDGSNGFQVHLWKCNINGEITSSVVVVAPEKDLVAFTTPAIKINRFTLIISVIITSIVIPNLLRKKSKKS